MEWVGLDWDEGPVPGDPNAFRGPHGPYRQMLRMDLYRAKIQQLLDQGLAYRCRCTREELDQRRKEAEAQGRPFLYDGRCRDRHWDASEPATIRLRMPAHRGHRPGRPGQGGHRGCRRTAWTTGSSPAWTGPPPTTSAWWWTTPTWGSPTWCGATTTWPTPPSRSPCTEALGYELPAFAHVPMILGKDKAKLSKRHGAASITEFRDLGFLPAAVRLTLAKLSWTPRLDGKAAESVEEELLTDQQMIEMFDLADIQKSAAVFDLDKLTWVNQKLIQRLDWREIEPHLRWQYHLRGQEAAWLARSDEWKALAIGCNKNRATLKEIADTLDFLFTPARRLRPGRC